MERNEQMQEEKRRSEEMEEEWKMGGCVRDGGRTGEVWAVAGK